MWCRHNGGSVASYRTIRWSIRMKKQSNVVLEEEEKASEAFALVLYHSASSSSYGDAVINKNEEEVG